LKPRLSDLAASLVIIDPYTGMPENIVLGFSGVSAESEHLSRYLFASENVRGLILDIASGTCYGSSILAHDKSNYVVATDINKNALTWGKTVYDHENLDFVLCNATRLPFRSRSFDSIVSFETLEHLDDADFYFDELYRVTKNGSMVIISTPNKTVTSPLVSKPLDSYHTKEYTLGGLLNITKVHKFDSIETYCQKRIGFIRFLARIFGVVLASLFWKIEVPPILWKRIYDRVERFVVNHDATNIDPDSNLYPIYQIMTKADILRYYNLILLLRKINNIKNGFLCY